MSAGGCIFTGAESQCPFPCAGVGPKVAADGSCSPVSPWEYFGGVIAVIGLSQSLRSQ